MRPVYIIGISAYYHDSAAVLISGDGVILAAAQEERFTRIKHDAAFPANAVRYILDEAGIEASQVETVAFYEKPFLKFERILDTCHSFVPRGLNRFIRFMPVWMKGKIFMRQDLRKNLKALGFIHEYSIAFPEHHLSHAASAFFPSPFNEAAILTIDGVGEWATSTICHGEKNRITKLRQLDFPHSVGLLYSAFTHYCGFRVNSGEYKLMGLAPFGNRDSSRVKKWYQVIVTDLVDIREDGSVLLNMEYFDFAAGRSMCAEDKWELLFALKRRISESKLTSEYADLALAVQQVTERIVLTMARTARQLTGSDFLVLAGGVALNCVANGRLARDEIFKHLWVQPAAGDAGGAIGAAMAALYIGKGKERAPVTADAMSGCYLGPRFCADDIERTARRFDAPYKRYTSFDALYQDTAALIAQGKIVGWFQGRMEFGPRALGNRSILADPRDAGMQKRLNMNIKKREGFRPFAPSVCKEDVADYFQTSEKESPYMLFTVPVNESLRKTLPENYEALDVFEKLYCVRSVIPAATHVDFSARVQTVSPETNEKFWNLIQAFKGITGCGVLLNTSFNVRGEPIVCTPQDAYRCFMKTEMDCLVMDQYVFEKNMAG